MDEDDNALADSESFFDLLQTFANLDLPAQQLVDEQCPLCPLKFPLVDFAPHVLACIRKLDDVEAEHQNQLDAKLARDIAEEEHELNLAHFRPAEECQFGQSCSRQDEGHFKQLRHPLVPCPICSSQFEIYQLNEHLNDCISGKYKLPEKTWPAFQGLPLSRQNSIDNSSDDDEDPREAERKKALSALLDNQNESGEGGEIGDDSLELEDMDVPRVHRAASSSNLSTRQMKAMSQLVLQERGKSGLSAMLDSFKTLGFTAENLREHLQEESKRMANLGSIGSAQPIHPSNPAPCLSNPIEVSGRDQQLREVKAHSNAGQSPLPEFGDPLNAKKNRIRVASTREPDGTWAHSVNSKHSRSLSEGCEGPSLFNSPMAATRGLPPTPLSTPLSAGFLLPPSLASQGPAKHTPN